MLKCDLMFLVLSVKNRRISINDRVIMPIMIRPKFGAKIAFAILGAPSNMIKSSNRAGEHVRKVLQSQRTKLSR